jgi:hypothetical protein
VGVGGGGGVGAVCGCWACLDVEDADGGVAQALVIFVYQAVCFLGAPKLDQIRKW